MRTINLHINDIVSINSNVKFATYAGDVDIFLAHQTIIKLTLKANEMPHRMVLWSAALNISVNKTKAIFFFPDRKISHWALYPFLCLVQHELEQLTQ